MRYTYCVYIYSLYHDTHVSLEDTGSITYKFNALPPILLLLPHSTLTLAASLACALVTLLICSIVSRDCGSGVGEDGVYPGYVASCM